MTTGFVDRMDAGEALAVRLAAYRDRADALVLGLPRGGVPVASVVADHLHLPLDVLVVRKLGAPGQPEFAIGAIASGGVIVMNPDVEEMFEGTQALQVAVARESRELKRREALYRNDRLPLDIHGRTVILVDDGAATGSTMIAAVKAVQRMGARRVVVAVPVASAEARASFQAVADEVACVLQPLALSSVAEWYRNFEQVDDAEVSLILSRAHLLASRRLSHSEQARPNANGA